MSVTEQPGLAPVDARRLLLALRAFRKGESGVRLPSEQPGLAGELAETFNEIVEVHESLRGELERVASAVAEDGYLTERASLPAAVGSWAACVNAVNTLTGGYSESASETIRVISAVARGDLSWSMPLEIQGRPVRGMFLEKATAINRTVEQLRSFAAELTHVAHEVGTEGKLGGQAVLAQASGVWKDLTDSVNAMASNLTVQLRDVSKVATAIAGGDLTQNITIDARGEILQIKTDINQTVHQLSAFASEVTRVAREVGTEGKLDGQARVVGVAGVWKDLTDSVNAMASNLTAQVRDVARVATAIARGDLTQKMTVAAQGEVLQLKETKNRMVDQLSAFASEVTRVAREVGTEGKLDGQANVPGAVGIWRDLTDHVNAMASNLTAQVRDVARVATAIAGGDLTQKMTVAAQGEVLQLKETKNRMVDQLSAFASEVTRVAREVGTEGKLGGQANLPGAAGTWRGLTDNVNRLASSVTTQVRAIADVVTAVTNGDLTRSITVEAQGEVAALKDRINEMIRNLRETTRKGAEQDWLKTNLARFTRMLQGQKEMATVARAILSELARVVNAQHAVFYLNEATNGEPVLGLMASYGYRERKNLSTRFQAREGLVGECAFEKQRILLTNVPEDYVRIGSGLGEATPAEIVVLPVVFEGQVKGVVELASLNHFTDIHLSFLDQLAETVGVVFNTIAATMQTEDLLAKSQAMTAELRAQQEELQRTNEALHEQAEELQQSQELLKSQQEELQQTNEELEEKAQLLFEQKDEVERKNRMIEAARGALEVKAEQLALTSRYKSEFLANMSHELRTPLNSMLILSKLLRENAEGNLTPKQVEFADTIHAAGADLLNLINEILDLSKIESGKIMVEPADVDLEEVRDFVERTFRQVAHDKGLDFAVTLDPNLPPSINTDATRLQQVLKNLLSNAFKFTDKGEVSLWVGAVEDGWSREHAELNRADAVVAFSVSDTGIGIPADKQGIIFEAFQQADGSTSRKYGGTGLGLSISREIARVLGGEIRVTSKPGEGSTFVLYLPRVCAAPAQADARGPVPVGEAPPRPPVRAQRAGRGRGRARGAEASQSGGNGPQAGQVPDDRDVIQETDRVLLIVEDDPGFARILLETAREKGFRVLVAHGGEAAVELARAYGPDAITLDIGLPDIDGWRVLDRLKADPKTRHIPVHIISAKDWGRRGLDMGAIAHLEKPVSKQALEEALASISRLVDRPVKEVLIVEDDEPQRELIAQVIGNEGVRTTAVGTGVEGLAALEAGRFDCLILDMGLPDMSGFEFIERLNNDLQLQELPIIVFTGKELTRKEETELKRLSTSIILKDSASLERLMAETALFLQKVGSNLPEPKRRVLRPVDQADSALAGRKVLVVDDDTRNIFALTSLLERHGMEVVYAEHGQEAIDVLQSTPGIDVVLMDVMMPEMEGYEAVRRIRQIERFKTLPIIALTAKAMKGDRERCLDAGASDYIPKPVDTEQLLSLLRVWLHRSSPANV